MQLSFNSLPTCLLKTPPGERVKIIRGNHRHTPPSLKGYTYVRVKWMINLVFSVEIPGLADQLPGLREMDGEKHPGDIAEAKRLMEAAGYSDGINITLSARNCCGYPETAEVVIQQLRELLGWNVDLKPWESSAGFDAYASGEYEFAVQGGLTSFPDPDAFLVRFDQGKTISLSTGYVPPGLPILLDKQARELDLDKRRNALLQIERVLQEDTPAVYLHWTEEHRIVHERVKNFLFQPYMRKYEHIWCDPRC